MKIEWPSYHSDGTPRRRPRPSTVHGWLAKMRGTLIGDEKLRWKGIQEMKVACAIRKYEKERKAQRKASQRGSSGKAFGFFGGKKKPMSTRRLPASRSRPQTNHRLVGRVNYQNTSALRPSRGYSGASRGSRNGQQPFVSRHYNSSRNARVRRGRR